ncbi:MAG: outer membrane lipoprotein carrier protein LolA [Bacteroidales bacterium]|jgi:outer membrane lipoprotein-sorting protein|nr:outer membrane lipoprotein carrier protein LolA [Bacteroidales bacterium]
MRKFNYIITLILVLSPAFSLQAQEQFRPMAERSILLKGLEEASAATRTISSSFIQEKNLEVLSEKIISRGIFLFSRENNIRWEYTQPYRYLIIISNGRMLTRDEKNQKLYDIESNRMFSEMNRFISGCIQGDILRNEKEYSASYFESSSQYLVKLVPRNEKMRQMLNEVQIWFDKKDFAVASLKMIESGQDFTRIDFIDRKINAEIPPEKFSF